jgi:hypothetical protein
MSRQAGSGDVEGGGGELSDWFMEHYPGAFADYLRATGQWIVFVSGFGLVAVGVLCLCLSALVAPTGSWWLGTLDAFGVGFVVGGVVDVLAIWGLNQVQTGSRPTGTRWRSCGAASMARRRSARPRFFSLGADGRLSRGCANRWSM